MLIRVFLTSNSLSLQVIPLGSWKLEILGGGWKREEDDGGSRQKEKELVLWVRHGKSLGLGFLEVALGSVLSTR